MAKKKNETEDKKELISEKSKKETEAKKEAPNYSRQLYWVLGVMVVIFVSFFLSTSVLKSMKTFEYRGMTFTKESLENIPLYTYSYNLVTPITGRATSQANVKAVKMILRGDPRENHVPLIGEIDLAKKKTVFIVTDEKGLTGCEYGSVGFASLSGFLTANGIKIEGALMNKEEAEKNNLKYVTCENRPNNPVIEITGGEETRVDIMGNCYSIKVANCEIMPAVEKLMVEMIVQAKASTSTE